MDWQIFAAAFGVGIGREAIHQYREWKFNRPEVPMDWCEKTQSFVPDLKLKRYERWATWTFFIVIAIHVVLGYNAVVNGWFN